MLHTWLIELSAAALRYLVTIYETSVLHLSLQYESNVCHRFVAPIQLQESVPRIRRLGERPLTT